MAIGDVTKRWRTESYATHIKANLSGVCECDYRPWWHGRWKIETDSAEFAEYQVKHAAAILARKAELEGTGFTVTVEDDNWIHIKGKGVHAGGQLDILATNSKVALVSDEKTGKKRAEDLWQVRVYMLLVELMKPMVSRVQGLSVIGEVVYKDETKIVRLTADHKNRISAQLKVVGSGVEPERTPTKKGCQYCVVPDCPVRIAPMGGNANGAF